MQGKICGTLIGAIPVRHKRQSSRPTPEWDSTNYFLQISEIFLLLQEVKITTTHLTGCERAMSAASAISRIKFPLTTQRVIHVLRLKPHLFATVVSVPAGGVYAAGVAAGYAWSFAGRSGNVSLEATRSKPSSLPSSAVRTKGVLGLSAAFGAFFPTITFSAGRTIVAN